MKKNEIFDYIIIGSGPTACFSALSLSENLKQRKKILLITGESKNLVFSNSHINFLKNIKKNKKYFEKFNILKTKKNLYSTGLIGGLSNFWGGQLQKYDKNDKFIENFKNYSQYNFYCKKVLENLKLLKIKYKSNEIISENFENFSPSFIFWNNNIFKKIINKLNRLKFLEIKKKRVQKIFKSKNFYEICFEKTTQKIKAKKIILATGTLSLSKILLNSTSQKNIFFCDHLPHYLFCLDMKNIIKNSSKYKNFKIIQKKINKKNIFFASVYDLSNFKINEIVSYFFKKNLFFLKNFKFLKFSKFIKPIQLWTPKMISVFQMLKNYKLKHHSTYDSSKDLVYKRFIHNLNKNLKIIGKSQNILGFHYHNLYFKINNKRIPLDVFLKKKFGKNIICVDSSSVKDISVLPPTFSTMALSYYKTKKFCKK